MDKQSESNTDTKLNLLGWLHVVTTAFVSIGFSAWFIPWLTRLLQWETYPKLLIAVPLLVVAIGYFVAGMYVSEWLGIRLTKDVKPKDA